VKIAYVVLKGMPVGGGIEKYTEEVGSRLAEKGHEVTVYTTRHYGSIEGTFKGMTIKTVPSFRSKSFEKITAAFMATIYQCSQQEVDIVHFHAFGPAMFCFIPRLRGRKVIVQGHGLEWMRSRWGYFGKLFLRLAEIPSVKFPHMVTAVSLVQKEYLLEKHGVKCVYIPTGVNPPQVEEPDLIKQYGLYGNDYILFVARLVREKGAHYLIDAYKRLNTDIKLVIAGDAEHEQSYKNELYQLAKGNDNIIFTGFATDKILHELFSNCYMFVLPSEMEGLPIALLEGMSYGNCCLISDIQENLQVLDDKGYSFRSKNIDDLSKKLDYLIKNSDAVGSVRQKAKAHVLENYSWSMVANKIEKLYIKLLNQ